MKNVKNYAAQGDLLIRRIDRLPDGTKGASGKEHVIAHSETGHHHVALGGVYHATDDPMLAYLVTQGPVVVEHRRSHDTHESLRLLAESEVGETVWEIRRQREYVPEGWRRVED